MTESHGLFPVQGLYHAVTPSMPSVKHLGDKLQNCFASSSVYLQIMKLMTIITCMPQQQEAKQSPKASLD